MSFEHKVMFRPAFDKRSKDPSKNYGVHGLEIQFQLIGPDGGVTYTIFTNWMLPHVQAETDARPSEGNHPYLFHKPISAGLEGHWKKQLYEGQTPVKNCEITGGDCYCDGTSITDKLFADFLAKGDSAIWQRLEECYKDWRPA